MTAQIVLDFSGVPLSEPAALEGATQLYAGDVTLRHEHWYIRQFPFGEPYPRPAGTLWERVEEGKTGEHLIVDRGFDRFDARRAHYMLMGNHGIIRAGIAQ